MDKSRTIALSLVLNLLLAVGLAITAALANDQANDLTVAREQVSTSYQDLQCALVAGFAAGANRVDLDHELSAHGRSAALNACSEEQADRYRARILHELGEFGDRNE